MVGIFLIRGFKFVDNTGMTSFQISTHYKRTIYIILTSELTFSTLLTDTYTKLRGAAPGPGCRFASSKKRCYCNGRWSLNTAILGGLSEFGLGRGFSLPPNYLPSCKRLGEAIGRWVGHNGRWNLLSSNSAICVTMCSLLTLTGLDPSCSGSKAYCSLITWPINYAHGNVTKIYKTILTVTVSNCPLHQWHWHFQ